MLSGECPDCNEPWWWGWNERQYGYYCALCGGCGSVFWIELSRTGVPRSHELFVSEVADIDNRTEFAHAAAKNRKESGLTIQQEAAGDFDPTPVEERVKKQTCGPGMFGDPKIIDDSVTTQHHISLAKKETKPTCGDLAAGYDPEAVLIRGEWFGVDAEGRLEPMKTTKPR